MERKLTKPCKKLFHIFKFKGRTIILCILYVNNYPISYLKTGMSICNPEDNYDEKLGKKIAESRANHERNLEIDKFFIYDSSESTYGLLNYRLKLIEEHIKLNPEYFIKSLKTKNK